MDAYEISAPGLEKNLQAGLRVPAGDTVALGNITVTKSHANFSVNNLAINASSFVLNGITYGPGQGVVFDLQVPSALAGGASGQVSHIDFAYTTAAGTIRTDRLYVLIKDAVAMQVSSATAGQSAVGPTSPLESQVGTVLGVAVADGDLGAFDGTTISNDATVKQALAELEAYAESIVSSAGGSYLGTWNASTNTPTITSSSGTNGDFYFVGTAGSTTIDGISSWAIGDQVRFNGTVWEKIPSSAAVSSVAGKTGAVTLAPGDVGLGNVTNVAQAPATRSITAGTGLSGGGDLTADRTLNVTYGTSAGTACVGNDSRLSDARTPVAHTHTASDVTDFNAAAAAAAPVDSVAGKTGVVTLGVADITGAAPLASPGLTGTPTAPTAAAATNTTQIATTAYVKSQGYVTSSGVTGVTGAAPITSSGGATPSIGINAATTSAAGSMSAADKDSLDKLVASKAFSVLDYGADPTGQSDCAQEIQNCIDAAVAVKAATNAGLGSSINRRYSPTIFFPPGTYVIDDPLVIATDSLDLNIVGDGAVLRQGSQFPVGRWLLEIGSHGTIENEAPMFFYMRNLAFRGFNYGVRIGGVDNNINLGRMYVQDCDFFGNEDQTGFAVRIFSRSSEITFSNCQWDNVIKAMDIQSCDGVFLDQCRCQTRRIPPYDITNRDPIHGYFTLRSGKLIVDRGSTFNPNLVTAFNSATSKSYSLWQNVSGDSTDDSPDKGSRWYSCVNAHTASAGQAFDEAYIGANFKIAESAEYPLAWFRAADFDNWEAGKSYILGDIVNYNTDLSVTGVTSTDVITSAGHGLQNNDKVLITALSGGSGLVVDRIYYVRDVTADTFKLYSSTSSSQAVDLGSDISSGTFRKQTLYWCSTAHASATWASESANWTAVTDSSISSWVDMNFRDVLFGGESGGFTPVIWDVTPDQIQNAVMLQRELTIRDCTIGSNRKGLTETGHACIALLCKIPNGLFITDNKLGYTYMVAADYWSETPPTMWEPWTDRPYARPQETRIEGNRGTAMRNLSTFDGPGVDYEQYGPDWAPIDLTIPTILVNNGGAAILPGNSKDRTFKTSRTSRYGGDTYDITGVDSTDTFTSTAHGLSNGNEVVLLSLTGGSNLELGRTYYVVNAATDTLQLATSSGGSAVDLGSDVSAGVLAKPMLITRFLGVSSGDHFRLWITDGSFKVADGNFIKGAGTFDPKTGGGIASYLLTTSDAPASVAYETSRTDFQ